MNSALEMAMDQNDDELAKLIKKDLSDAKLRLSSWQGSSVMCKDCRTNTQNS